MIAVTEINKQINVIEAGILSAISLMDFNDADSLDLLKENISDIKPEHFTNQLCRRIWDAINQLLEQGHAPDITSVIFESTIGNKEAAEILSSCASPELFGQYKDLLLEKYNNDKNVITKQNAINLIHEGKIDEAKELLDSLNSNSESNPILDEWVSIKTEQQVIDHFKHAPDALETDYIVEGEELTIPSGTLSFIAAPTSHGKTSMLLNLALQQVHRGKKILVLTFEEDRHSIFVHALNIHLNMELSKDNTKTLKHYFKHHDNEHEKYKFFSGNPEKQKCLKSNFKDSKDNFIKNYIDTNLLNINYTDSTIESLCSNIAKIKDIEGIDAVFIDYMQLLDDDSKDAAGLARQEKLKRICHKLKNTAIKTSLPIILGAQFNRQVVSPSQCIVTNVGEAGDIERIANKIIAMWNGNFHNWSEKDKQESLKEFGISSPEEAKNKIWLKVIKNRDGVVGISSVKEFKGNNRIIKNTIHDKIKDESREDSAVKNEETKLTSEMYTL